MQQWYVDYTVVMVDGTEVESSCHPAAVYKPVILSSEGVRKQQTIKSVIDEAAAYLRTKFAADPEVSLWRITGAGLLGRNDKYVF